MQSLSTSIESQTITAGIQGSNRMPQQRQPAASSTTRACAQENPSKNNSIAITRASSRPVWDG